MRKITWLHFSDIHLNKAGVETRRLRRALIPYLQSLQLRCDYVFFTGDVRYAPGGGTFTSDMAEKVKTICRAVSCPTDCLFVVPGNHDVDREISGRQKAIERLCLNGNGYYVPNEGRINENDLKEIALGKDSFCEFVQELYSENSERVKYYKDLTHPHFNIETDDFNVVHIDSTLTYTGEHEQNLLIGTELLLNLMEEIDPNKITIFLTHYSFDFLSRDEQNQIYAIMKDFSAPIWIAGHEHDALCRKQRDYFYEFQSGNLMLEQGAKSCILIGTLDIDTGEGQVEVHAWFEGAGWAKYPFIRIREGDNSIYPFQLRLTNEPAELDDNQQEIDGALQLCKMYERQGGMFFGVEYNQKILPDLQSEKREYKNIGEINPLMEAIDDLWKSKEEQCSVSCHALLLGNGGMGKSTMLFCACKELLQRHQLAVYVPLYILQMQNRSIEEWTIQSLYGESGFDNYDRWKRLTRRADGRQGIVLLIDGFNELDSKWAYRITNELRQLSLCQGVQIIASSRLDFLRYYGMTYFQMLNVCELRDEQIKGLFSDIKWKDIVNQRNLHGLVKNPMMALLYAQVSPIVDKYKELEFCDWRMKVNTATDMMHNYYMAQIAIVLERSNNNAEKIFAACSVIRYVMPYLAFYAELRGSMEYSQREFDDILKNAIESLKARMFGEAGLPEDLDFIRKKYRVDISNAISVERVYDIIVTELCLLREQGNVLHYRHQMYRDYEAAVYWYDALLTQTDVTRFWTQQEIHVGVVNYLRDINDSPWMAGGLLEEKLRPYRGCELSEDNYFVKNLVNCWLPKDPMGKYKRDLSYLDLRRISLAEILKNKYLGKIDIDNAMVDKKTFVNEERHDCIIGLAFSHDGQLLAAISENGIVSVCNIATQSQMIVGTFVVQEKVRIYYSAEDLLTLHLGQAFYQWTSIAYDKVKSISEEQVQMSEIIKKSPEHQAGVLYRMLKDSDMLGSAEAVSDDNQYLAVGYLNGHVQIWNTNLQIVIADLVLGDCEVQTASFSNNGTIAAIGSGGKLVQLWDTAQEKCCGVIHFEKQIRHARFPAVTDSKELVLECEYSDGTCFMLNISNGEVEARRNTQMELVVKKMLQKKLAGRSIRKIEVAGNGNALVLLNKSNTLYTWNQKTGELNMCTGHESKVLDAAICLADPRYAASYSDERIHAKGEAAHLNGQKVIRARAVRKGNCMQRLPVGQRTIEKIRFFTTNRIILAAFATNGDILLWELENRMIRGKECGHWEKIDIVKRNTTIPFECAVSTEGKTFLGIYTNGTMFVRTFDGDQSEEYSTLPGIDPTSLQWNDLVCEDELKEALGRYRHFDT